MAASACAGLPEVAFKSRVDDFVVEELFDEPLTGSGEHACFYVEKAGRNTADVVEALKRATGCRSVDIGYCGRKDKHATTRQWFSVSGIDAWPHIEDPAIRCLAVDRHARKLRFGMHAGNRFEVTLRACPAGTAAKLAPLVHGFANYFGPQRVSAANCAAAREWLRTRTARRGQRRRGGSDGWHLSVLRSELFNAVLSRRAATAAFPAAIPGDVLVDGLPTGPLWGRGRSAAQGAALEEEQAALEPYADICAELEFCGVSQDRRPLWVRPGHFEIADRGAECQVSFVLPPGAYATAMLSQAVTLVEPDRG